MKTLEKSKALELRKQGRTFREILEEIPVSKGSLSYWLKDVDLTPEQTERIQYKNKRVKDKFLRFNNLRRKKAADAKKAIISSSAKEINHLTERELKLVGIGLYWA